jgi:hypothetical protein
MAKVEYAFPVDKVHGRISKQHKVGFAHRKASKRNYTTVYGTRSTPAGIDEINARKKFAAVCKSTRLRMTDPVQNPIDQVGYAKQSKYPTFYGYVFRQEWDAYVEE